MEPVDVLGFMERNECFAKEFFVPETSNGDIHMAMCCSCTMLHHKCWTEERVLLLQRESESVDDTTKDLEKFGDATVLSIFVYICVENAIDRTANERPMRHEFSIGSVQNRL